MNCPRCQSPLSASELEGARAERCASCHGTWISREAFRDAAEHADEESGWLAFELWRDAERFRGIAGQLPCPSCAKGMPRLSYGDAQVSVDVCPDCAGVWLDPDELERTVTALRTELVRLPARELLSVAFEEATEIAKREGSLAAEWRHLARVARLLELRVLTDHPQLRKLLMSLQGGRAFP